MLKRLFLAALVLIPAVAFAGSIHLLRVGKVSSSVAGSLKAPFFSTFRLSTAGPGNFYGAGPGTETGAEQNSISATSTVRRIPIPFPATLSNLHTNLATAPVGTDTVVDSITNTAVSTTPADGTVTCQYGSNTATSCFDDTHSDTLVAGSLFAAHFTYADAAQTTPGQISWILTATNKQYVSLSNQPNASGNVISSATPVFFGPDVGGVGTVEATISFQFCPACGGTILGFFLLPNVTETGTHTWTVMHNGSATGMTFNTSSATTGGGAAGQCISPNGSSDSIGGGTVVNPCTSNSGLTFTVAPGDTISVQANCPAGSGCSTSFPGFSIIYSPNTSGTVPLSSINTSAAVNLRYLGVSTLGVSAVSSQTNFQQAPAGMTFSNFQFCSLTAPSSGTQTATFQTGATPGTAPTTPGTTLAATFGTTGVCPTNGTYAVGADDLTHNVTVTKDQTVDTLLTSTGTTGTQSLKVSMAVVVSASGGSSAPILIDLPMSVPGPAFLP